MHDALVFYFISTGVIIQRGGVMAAVAAAAAGEATLIKFEISTLC